MLPRRYLEGQPGLLASHSCSLSCVFRDKVLLFQACVLAPEGRGDLQIQCIGTKRCPSQVLWVWP